MDRTKEIIKAVNSLSGNKSPYQVFSDWIKCAALSLSQSCFKTKKREQQYIETIKEYPAQEFSKMAAMLAETIESSPGDILGNLFMLSGWGNKNTGQFFTPYSVSLAVARLQSYENNKIVKMNEPAAGAGGMIIAVAQAMKENGINYQKQLRVIAQDLDLTAFYMCYTQLSLMGNDAKCVQGDTLENQPFSNLDENVFLTPMYFINGCVW